MWNNNMLVHNEFEFRVMQEMSLRVSWAVYELSLRQVGADIGACLMCGDNKMLVYNIIKTEVVSLSLGFADSCI